MVETGWQARRSPLPLLEYRQHSRYQTNIQVGSFSTLQFYQNLSKETRFELERSQSQIQQIQSDLQFYQDLSKETRFELERSQSQIQQIQSELERLQNIITAMETSKFWKFRKIWFKFKHLLRLG
jgi:chromosome segregation ATPase